MVNTPRKTREKLIIQWYEKKLNRDELFKVLDGSEIFDDENRKKIKKEIVINFYENYEKAKKDEGFKSADKEYKDIKETKKTLEEKSVGIAVKKKEAESELQEIDSQMLDIAEGAMKLENGAWWKKWKLRNTIEKWDDLEAQQKRIRNEMKLLERERIELQSKLKEKEEKYGPKIERKIKRPKKIEIVGTQKTLNTQTTLKGYREKYLQMIQDREEYMKNLLSEIKNMDLGISEEKKKEVLDLVKANMQKEINSMKGGDEILKLADETEKWLEDNRKVFMERLSELEGKIREKKNEIKKIESMEKGAKTDEILQIRERQFTLKKELLELRNEYEIVKGEIDEKLKQYEGKGIDLPKELHVKSWKKRKEKIKRMEEKDSGWHIGWYNFKIEK